MQGSRLYCAAGIGKVNSAIAAQLMTDRFDVGAVVVSGAAAKTDDRIKLFDTVICDTAVYHDFASGRLKAESPYMSEAVFKSGQKPYRASAGNRLYIRLYSKRRLFCRRQEQSAYCR